jgi:hypothetical protein
MSRRRVDAIGNPPSGEASSKICPKREDQKSASLATLSISFLKKREYGELQ